MLIGSFISGLVPMAFKLSDNKSRLLALLGSGILVGTALAIIVPEGIDSLYGQQSQLPTTLHSKVITETKSSDLDTKSDHVTSTPQSHPQPTNRTWTIGSSLIVGFILMLLIDQFSIYQGGSHHDHASSIEQSTSGVAHYSLASQEDDVDVADEEEDEHYNAAGGDPETTSETKAIKEATTSNNINHMGVQIHPSPNKYYDHSRHIPTGHNNRTKSTKVTPTLGLVIHAAADGIALGAAATTSHKDVEMIIFLAIMLHKAPAAFSLVVLLLHRGLKPSTARRHLMAFSLSAPIAAMVTYFGLSQSGKEALRRNNATGIAMLFSAGTFLFVATVHVLPDLIHNKLLKPKELCCLVGGAFLPLILAQTV